MPPRSDILLEYLESWVMPTSGSSSSTPSTAADAFEMLGRVERCAELLATAWPAPGVASSDSGITPTIPELPAAPAGDLSVGSQITLRGAEPWETSRQFGRFHVVRPLGSGGMGQVFLAIDPTLRREVALKVPHPGLLISERARERFLREARAAGLLQHPHIVPVHECGEVGPVCYIVSQYCAGPTLSQWLRERKEKLPLDVVARVVSVLAGAMQHAHERGVLHRDLKPSNILLDPIAVRSRGKNGSVPSPVPADPPGSAEETDAANPFPFTPRIADFGLADIEFEDATVTITGSVIGTARYMAPEQASGQRNLVGPRTDVYALGVILYELITGCSPFQRESLVATLAAVQREQAPSPSQLRHDLPADLEAICQKAMNSEPALRYRSAGELGDDLERFLRGEPVLARAIGPFTRLTKWARREPAYAVLMGALLLAVVAAAVSVLWNTYSLQRALNESQQLRQRAETAERNAVHRQRLLEDELYATDIAAAETAWKGGDLRTAHAVLRRSLVGRLGPDSGRPTDSADATQTPTANSASELTPSRDLRGWEWHYLWQNVTRAPVRLVKQQTNLYRVVYAPNGRQMATAGADGTIRFYAAETLAELGAITTPQREVNGVAFTHDMARLASAGDDGTVRVWDRESGKECLTIQAHQGHAFEVVFTRDERQLITCGDEPTIRIWTADTGAAIRSLEGHTRSVEALALSPDGRQLASAGSDDTVRVWRVEDGQLLHTWEGFSGRATCVAYSPDGTRLAGGDVTGRVLVWDVETRELLLQRDELDGIQSLAWLPNGSWLSVGTRSGNLCNLPIGPLARRIQQPAGTDSVSWRAHDDRIYSIAYSTDGQHFASVGNDGQLKLWHASQFCSPLRETMLTEQAFSLLAPVGHGNKLLTAINDHVVIVERATGKLTRLEGVTHHSDPIFVATDGRRLVVGYHDGSVYRGDVTTGLNPQVWFRVPPLDFGALSFSPDGSQLLVVSEECIQIRDARTARVLRTLPIEGGTFQLALSPDGRWLVACEGNEIVVWDLKKNASPRRLTGHKSTVRALAFSPDGRMLASSAYDRRIKFWNWPEGMEIRSLEGAAKETEVLAFSPDGRTLFGASPQHPLAVWHVPTGRQLLTVDMLLTQLVVGPGAAQLAGVTRNGNLWLCDLKDVPPARQHTTGNR